MVWITDFTQLYHRQRQGNDSVLSSEPDDATFLMTSRMEINDEGINEENWHALVVRWLEGYNGFCSKTGEELAGNTEELVEP